MNRASNPGTRYGRVLLVEGGLPPVTPPYRGMFWSGVLHAVSALGLYSAILLARYVTPRAAAPFNAPTIELTQLEDKHEAIFLPATMSGPRGGHEGASGKAGGESGRNSAAAPSAGRRGEVTYRGAQTIVSDPLMPDNKVQTIRRPDLVNAPVLHADIRVPNLAAFKVVAPEFRRTQEVVATEESRVEAAIPMLTPTVVEPKLTVPASPTEQPAPAPEVKPLQIRRAIAAHPQPAQPPKIKVNAKSSFPIDLLVVNAVPVLEKQATLPPGQRQGRFVIVAGNTSGSGELPGGGKASDGTGVGGEGANGTGNAPGGGGRGTGTAAGTGSGNGNGHGGGNGGGHGTGIGKGTGTGSGSSGTGTGRGISGSGAGDGTGAGSGSGSGNGSGDDGLTIIGGVGGGRASGTPVPTSLPKRAGESYDLTIIGSSSNTAFSASEFGSETAYTVFISMRESDVPGPDWTLQYALVSHGGHSGLLASPAPVEKNGVRFPDALALRYASRSAIVGGVVDENGKLLGLHVVRSPDSALTASLFDALQKWRFRAAEIDGKAVAVKVLITIPIVVAPR